MRTNGLFVLLGVFVVLLSGCNQKIVEYTIGFPNEVVCNESVSDFFEMDSLDFPENIDHGYLYSYVFDYGQFIFTFHNPDATYANDEFITRGAYGNRFLNSDGAYLKTEIPEGYYLYDVTYKYTSTCREGEDETKILVNITKSILVYSDHEYEEADFLDEYTGLKER